MQSDYKGDEMTNSAEIICQRVHIELRPWFTVDWLGHVIFGV